MGNRRFLSLFHECVLVGGAQICEILDSRWDSTMAVKQNERGMFCALLTKLRNIFYFGP